MVRFRVKSPNGFQKTLVFDLQEVKALCVGIGFDFVRDRAKYEWFLIYALLYPLPFGWIKEQDPAGDFVYYNTTYKILVQEHPLTLDFRKQFANIVKYVCSSAT